MGDTASGASHLFAYPRPVADRPPQRTRSTELVGAVHHDEAWPLSHAGATRAKLVPLYDSRARLIVAVPDEPDRKDRLASAGAPAGRSRGGSRREQSVPPAAPTSWPVVERRDQGRRGGRAAPGKFPAAPRAAE